MSYDEQPDATLHGECAAEIERLTACLSKINDIRTSIIGLQRINWSEHIYPLVAALDEAGFECPPYEQARENVGTLLERANKAEDENARLLAAVDAERGEPVATIERNACGQIRIVCRDGEPFDLFANVGVKLYTAPQPARDPAPVIHYEEQPDGAITQVQPEDMRACRLCDCSGDIHSPDGEWRGQCPYCQPARDPAPLVEALNHAATWINCASHGDNCFLSDNYDGDPGNRCNCGKESAESAVVEALAAWEASS